MARKNNRSSAAVANGSAHLGNDVDKSESKAKANVEAEPTMEKEHEVKTISDGTAKVAKKVRGGEKMSVLLTQAIVSGDDEKLDLLISQAATNSINPTVRDLPVAHVVPFIKLLEKRFRTTAAYDMSRVLRWIIPILHNHMPYLTSLPDLNSKLGSLLDWLNQRTSQMDKLLALQGKMTLIMDQMDRRSNPISYASQEPEIVFHPDKADSDSDLNDDEDEESDAGDSADSWWEEDDEEGKQDIEMEDNNESDEDESSGDSDDSAEGVPIGSKRPRTADSDESSEDSCEDDEMDIG
ncbi:hypothetical protein QR680_005382 [Steinernema hermaphroditum]|uniref:Small-subunit processome Utp12 domain-containing protein n=1 Tax=Steinernema hermaphroditum TaxID=289476 RepID=A0AA39HT73_9BILA|nr:hypothetical protein QR680_005382 [Steinernema hermaphroditum]